MSLFVDHVGLNTLISEDVDTTTNTRTISATSRFRRPKSISAPSTAVTNPRLSSAGLTGWPTTGGLSISVWVNLDNSAVDSRHIYANTIYSRLYFQNNKLRFLVSKTSSVYKEWEFNISLSDFVDNWKHIFISWDGDYSNNPSLKIDNVTISVSSTAGTASGTGMYWASSLLLFDYIGSNTCCELQGKMINFAIWNSSSVSSTILYNQGVPLDSNLPDGSGLIDFWLLGDEVDIEIGDAIPESTIVSSQTGSALNDLVAFNGLQISSGLEGTVKIVREDFVGTVDNINTLAALNTHRNGPYGFSSWQQIRISENPITRHHNKNSTMTLVTRGSTIDLPEEGGNNYRERYSTIHNFKEPVVTQKHHPVVWTVGNHYKNEATNEILLQKFSIVSSYGNQLIDFSNREINEKLNYRRTDKSTEYPEILNLYANGGLSSQESPITYWEFIQYRETVYPQQKYGYVDTVRDRPQFSFPYNKYRNSRTKTITETDFGFSSSYGNLSQSQWTLDAGEDFLTRTEVVLNFSGSSSNFARNGEGVLQNSIINFVSGAIDYRAAITSSVKSTVLEALEDLKNQIGASPMYSRKHTISSYLSIGTTAGMEIVETGSSGIVELSGDALWETSTQREIKNTDGVYIKEPRHPFRDSYREYADSVRRYGKNFSVVPEFRMSAQLNDYIRSGTRIEQDSFELTGAILGLENSSKEDFYKTYSNSDFMKHFEIIRKDHEGFTTGEILNLRCKAIKKFLPYEGFYPAQRSVDLAKSFYDSTKKHISFKNENDVIVKSEDYPFVSQNIINPLFAPGILFNSFKSGIAVDYPIFTGSISTTPFYAGQFLYMDSFDKRIPFEALINPQNYLAGFESTNNEPFLSSSYLDFSSYWDGIISTDYPLMANNFLASCIDFFLPNGNLTSIVSRRQQDGFYLKDGEEYGMRLRMFRSMDGTKNPVHKSGSTQLYNVPQDLYDGTRETFTMYSRASSFGPPSIGLTTLTGTDASSGPHQPIPQSSIDFLINGDDIYTGDLLGQNFPFTPPYYHGDSWCTITITGSGRKMTIEELQASASYEYSRYEYDYMEATDREFAAGAGNGPQAVTNINRNAVQLSASLNVDGLGSVKKTSNIDGSNIIVDTALDQDARWIIQTKFETPMLNFQHATVAKDNVTLPQYASESVSRGLWHQHGRIPEEDEGVFMSIGEIPLSYQIARMGKTEGTAVNDLSDLLGFSSEPTKLGRISQGKTISEAVVAVPYVELDGSKKFFKLDKEKVKKYKEDEKQSITTGDVNSMIGKSVIDQLDKMQKFIFPPSFDFINYDTVDPIAMYIFEFSHTLSQQDLSDIWQNIAPDISENMEVSEVSISHPLLRKELLGAGGDSGNDVIKTPSNLKWMVFKVKQRAPNNYYKKVVSRSSLLNQDQKSSNSTLDEFGLNSPLQYNWPYDFFSLIEMVRLDAEVEMGSADFSNYSSVLPRWDVQEPPPEQLSTIVAVIGPEITHKLTEAEIDYIEETAENYQENQDIKNSAGRSRAESSQRASVIENQIVNQLNASVNAGELSIMRSRAAAGQSVPQGVDFSSLNSFMSTAPSNAMLNVGIPMDEYANGMIALNSLVTQYTNVVSTYGVNSAAANSLLNQLGSLNPEVISSPIASSILSAANISIGPRQ